MSDRLPTKRRPYFICSPPYTSKSAGVVTLYRLCHYLNEAGYKAWIMPIEYPVRTSSYLNAPVLTKEISDFFIHEGIDPVFIFPDIIKGNIFGGKRICWFLLHYPGAYGGQATFHDPDKVWSFSPHIASHTKHPKNVMSVPNIDLDIFKLPPEGTKRSGGCFYANKYLNAGHNLLPLIDGLIRLQGTHEEMAKVLQTKDVCYVYENTSVISEAVLCGCPVVLVRSDYFKDIHSLETQTGHAGVRWMDQHGLTSEPVENAHRNYQSMCDKFFNEQLPRFLQDTQ